MKDEKIFFLESTSPLKKENEEEYKQKCSWSKGVDQCCGGIYQKFTFTAPLISDSQMGHCVSIAVQLSQETVNYKTSTLVNINEAWVPKLLHGGAFVTPILNHSQLTMVPQVKH